jgi:hypothetical protein
LHKRIRTCQGRPATAGRDCLLQDWTLRLGRARALEVAVRAVREHEAREEVKRAQEAEQAMSAEEKKKARNAAEESDDDEYL